MRSPRSVLLVAVIAASSSTTGMAAVGLFREPGAGRRLVGLVVLVAVLAAQALVLLGGVSVSGERRPPVAPLVVLAVVLGASVPLLAPVGADGWETWVWVAAGVAGTVPLVVGRWLGLAAVVVLTVAAAGVGQWVAAEPGRYAVLTASIAAGLLLVQLLPVRLWRLLAEARAGRDAAVRLAAAEERLRFAADVHDLLGHHLTVIALQAELAARTAATDPGAAAGHAEHARSLAATALAEMRRVVHGYRAVDLDAQLAAVAQVLQASGVRCTVSGSGHDLPPGPAAVLAATAREAGTNVLRHSRARWCTIDLVRTAERTELRITNDGAVPAPAVDRYSSGLRGLITRLADVGGSLETGVDDGVFTVFAAVPSAVDAPPSVEPPSEPPRWAVRAGSPFEVVESHDRTAGTTISEGSWVGAPPAADAPPPVEEETVEPPSEGSRSSTEPCPGPDA